MAAYHWNTVLIKSTANATITHGEMGYFSPKVTERRKNSKVIRSIEMSHKKYNDSEIFPGRKQALETWVPTKISHDWEKS